MPDAARRGVGIQAPPTMKWLMKQLEKRGMGTGATRTSTYSEVANDKAKYPLLTEEGRKLRLAQAGEMELEAPAGHAHR